MVSEILLEGSRLDLFEDLGAELNYAIDDIKDFSSRNTNYSKTITLPGNANNNKIFGHIYNFTSANNYYVSDPNSANVGYNFDPSKQASCKIFVNKIQVFKGVLRLLEIKIDNGTIEYECVVFGELGGFASAIGNSLLEDLDTFNAYNQAWNATNIVNSWTASGVASGMGIVYPLIDYGKCKHGGSDKDYHINAFRPAFFVKEMMDGIIGNSGYTYESAFLETPYFKSLIIPNNKAQLEQSRKDLLSVTGAYGIVTASETVRFSIISNISLFTNSNNSDFTFTGTSGTLGKISIIGAPFLSRVGSFTLTVYQNAIILFTETFVGNTDYQQFPIDWLIETSLNNGDSIAINATFSSLIEDCDLSPNLTLEFLSDYPQASPATVDGILDMKYLIPKGIQQKDFFASICRMFNLYVYEDVDKTKHLLIEPYIDFYRTGAGFLKINDLGELLLHGQPGDTTGLLLLSDPVADSIDWSNKVDYSKEISLKPMSELNSRYYDFVYTKDSDYYNDIYFKKYNESYADRKEDTKFQFATERTEIKVIFSPSVLIARTGDDKLCASIFKVENQVEVPMDCNIRIMQFSYITGKTNWNIKGVSPSNTNISSTLNSYGYGGHLDNPDIPTNDLNYGVPNQVYFTLTSPFPSANLFTAFWGDYLAEITSKDSKLLTCYLYLKIIDIYSLDFAQLIYIDGALWRLNKIIDFNPTIPQTTKVELLRVIELTYE
jgi:hypothetical protein